MMDTDNTPASSGGESPKPLRVSKSFLNKLFSSKKKDADDNSTNNNGGTSKPAKNSPTKSDNPLLHQLAQSVSTNVIGYLPLTAGDNPQQAGATPRSLNLVDANSKTTPLPILNPPQKSQEEPSDEPLSPAKIKFNTVMRELLHMHSTLHKKGGKKHRRDKKSKKSAQSNNQVLGSRSTIQGDRDTKQENTNNIQVDGSNNQGDSVSNNDQHSSVIGANQDSSASDQDLKSITKNNLKVLTLRRLKQYPGVLRQRAVTQAVIITSPIKTKRRRANSEPFLHSWDYESIFETTPQKKRINMRASPKPPPRSKPLESKSSTNEGSPVRRQLGNSSLTKTNSKHRLSLHNQPSPSPQQTQSPLNMQEEYPKSLNASLPTYNHQQISGHRAQKGLISPPQNTQIPPDKRPISPERPKSASFAPSEVTTNKPKYSTFSRTRSEKYLRDEKINSLLIGNEQLKQGTLDEILDWVLAYKTSSDMVILHAFFLCFPKFWTPVQLLTKLEDKFCSTGVSEFAKIRIASILRRWIESYFIRDGKGDTEFTYKFQNFNADIQAKLPGLLKVKPLSGIAEDKIAPVFGAGVTPTKYEFVDFSSLEFAEQVALHDQKAFNEVKPWHFIETLSKHKENALDRFITQFNNMSFWVAYEVVTCPNSKKRAVLIKRFIAIAQCCRDNCNFNSLMAILSGLNMSSVKRLKQTWANVPHKSLKKLEDLEKVMSPINNFQVYRETMLLSTPPVIPFLAVHNRDIQFIEDGNPTHMVDTQQINFGKQIMFSCTISEMMHLQNVLYDFKSNSVIQNFLHNLVVLPESRLYKCSLACEPKSSELV